MDCRMASCFQAPPGSTAPPSQATPGSSAPPSRATPGSTGPPSRVTPGLPTPRSRATPGSTGPPSPTPGLPTPRSRATPCSTAPPSRATPRFEGSPFPTTCSSIKPDLDRGAPISASTLCRAEPRAHRTERRLHRKRHPEADLGRVDLPVRPCAAQHAQGEVKRRDDIPGQCPRFEADILGELGADISADIEAHILSGHVRFCRTLAKCQKCP